MSDLLEEMTAARQQTVEQFVKKQWDELKPKIDAASAQGKNTLHLTYGIGTSLSNYLKKTGFEIDTDRGDYQSCGYTVISW